MMSRNINREESLRIAAEKVRRKKEKERLENEAFYRRITSGPQWILFKVVVVFCTVMAVVTTIEHFFDGPTEQLAENSWEIDKNWEYTGHAVINADGYMFTPTYLDWWDHIDSTISITYSPIFRTGKKLNYDSKINDTEIKSFVEIRRRSIFTWFPFFQILLLIPLATFIFKQQSPWFNFARILSLVFVFPATILVVFFTMM